MEKGLYCDTLFCKYNNYFADYTCFFLSLQLCYVLKAVIILERVNVSCVPFVIVRKKQSGFGDVCIISFNSIINLLGISLSYIELSSLSLIKEKRNLDLKSSITTKRQLAKSESATRRGWRASERGPGNKTDGGINSADTLRRISLPGPVRYCRTSCKTAPYGDYNMRM